MESEKVVKAPLFKPTVEEFSEGPFAYISKINSLNPGLSICLIEPPLVYQPDDILDQDLLSFNPTKTSFIDKKVTQCDNLCTFRSFCDIGDDFKREFFKSPPDMVPLDEIEDAFWSLQSSDSDLEITQAFKLPMELYRPKYLVKSKNRDDCLWSFSHLNDSRENLLSFLNKEAKKFLAPTLDIGMCFTQLNWQRGIHWCVLLSYHHYGDSRIWYGISPQYSQGFLTNLNHRNIDTSPQNYDDKSVISLSVDISDNIQLIRAEQQAGQFLVIYPGVIHSAFDVGVNLVESLPIAPAFWLKMGQEAVEFFADICHSPFFSHEELISRAASDADNLSIELAESILPQIIFLFEKESTLKCSQSEFSYTAIRKRAFELMPYPYRRCRICDKIVFFSCLSCDCSDKFLCIEHEKDTCKSCSNCTYNYRYSERDKNFLITSLKQRLQEYSEWLSDASRILSANDQKCLPQDLFSLINIAKQRRYPKNHTYFLKLVKLEKEYKDLMLIFESLVRQNRKLEAENERKSKIESSLALASLSSTRIKKKMESEKENTNTSPLKSRSSKIIAHERSSNHRQITLPDYRDFCATVKSFPITFVNHDWLLTLLKKCDEISASIKNIFDSGEYTSSQTLEQLLHDIHSVSFIDFSNELKLINSKLIELKWLDECQSLLNDQISSKNDKVYDVGTIKTMIENGLVLKSNSRDVINCLNKLHKIHGDASKWINNSKVLLNIVKQAEHLWDEDASKPTIGELAALAEEIKENPGLRKVDLSPYSQELEKLLSECRLWMNKVLSAMNSFRSDNRNENDVVFVTVLEDLFTKGKELGCQLKDLSRIKKILDTTNTWKNHIERVFLRKKPLYKLLNILVPLTNSLLPASVDLMSSSRCYYQQLKKQAITIGSKDSGKKSSRFERLLNNDYSQEKIRQVYLQAEEDEEIEMSSVRDKRAIKNSEAAQGTEETFEKSSKEREKFLKKFCFCGKPISSEWIIHCKTCQEWYHANCIQPYLPIILNTKGKKQSTSTNEDVREQFNFICPLCCRGNRPSFESVQSLIKSYLNLPVKMLEGELLLCLYERAERFKAKFKDQISQYPNLLRAYTLAETNYSPSECSSQEISSQSSSFKSKRKSPLVLRGELSDSQNLELDDDSKHVLWELLCEGNLIEIFIPEVQNLWMVWHMANPAFKTMVFVENTFEAFSGLAANSLFTSSKKSSNEELDCDTDKTDVNKTRLKRKRKERLAFDRSSKRKGRKSKTEDLGEISEEVCSMDMDCLRPTGKVDWICCDGSCQGWFHQLCAGVTSQEVRNIEEYFCKSCKVNLDPQQQGNNLSEETSISSSKEPGQLSEDEKNFSLSRASQSLTIESKEDKGIGLEKTLSLEDQIVCEGGKKSPQLFGQDNTGEANCCKLGEISNVERVCSPNNISDNA